MDIKLEFNDKNPYDNLLVEKEFGGFNDTEIFIQEIEIALKVGPSEIFGLNDGLNLGKYVFDKYITRSEVINRLTTYITNNCSGASTHTWYLDAEIVLIENKRVLLISMTIQKIKSDNFEDNPSHVLNFMYGAE